MTNDKIIVLLVIGVIVIGIVFMVLLTIYTTMKLKQIKKKREKEREVITTPDGKVHTMIAKQYTKDSIFNFMEFDKVEDNMIIQKNRTRYLMVITCQGVNYDLMSEVEKTSVEEGFQEFLNTLRSQIQIYTQTRSVNLEGSLENYRIRLKKIEDKLTKLKAEYESMKKSGQYTKEELDRVFFEITKQKNLYDYGKDIVLNTEKMSLNKNVLNKQYYIVVPYYTAELGSHNFNRDEIQNIAFSELFTKAQAVMRSLSACGVVSRILSSQELVELLYMSYNRDEAEVYGMDKIIKAGYEELYSTAPDVFDKKIRLLQQEIEQKGLDKANEIVGKVFSAKEEEYREKENNLDDLIDEMAEAILKSSEANIGTDIMEKSLRELNKAIEKKKKKEGGKENEQKKKETRGRKPKYPRQ